MKLKKPEFNIHPHDFMIIFKANYKYDYNPMLDEGTQNVPVNVPVNIINKLSKTEEKVLNVIATNKYATRENIANELSLSVKTIARAINNLKDMHIINRTGSDKKGSWEIIK